MNDKKKIVKYWVKSTEHDLDVAKSLFEIQKYDWALFIGHLVIEKILKAHFVNDNEKIAPKTHDIVYLAKNTMIEFDYDKIRLLDVIKDFNMEARYPDDKFSFYKKCTKEFTEDYLNQIIGLYEWLKSQIRY